MTGNTDIHMLVTDTLKKSSENQSVSGVTTTCLMQRDTFPSHRVNKDVDCGLWNVVPLLFNGFVKLLDIGGNWNTLSTHRSSASQTCSMGDMSGKYIGHVRTGTFLGPCIIMLKRRRLNGTTMGLRISSQYLCALKLPSIKCNCVHCP